MDNTEFNMHFRAAVGYTELDMAKESQQELELIAPEFQDRIEVQKLWLHLLMGTRKWRRALKLCQKICRAEPNSVTAFLHGSFCLGELGKPAEARKFLLSGPDSLLKEPIYHYNMSCYEARLGKLESARINLLTSIRMDPSYREVAKTDPDLKPLLGSI